MDESPADVTLLLRAAADGGRDALDQLVEAIYADLKRIAAAHLRTERADHTLDATALVHEAWLRLVDQRVTDWNDRVHFFAAASRIIRRLLVDHARARAAGKRGDGRRPLHFSRTSASASASASGSGSDAGLVDPPAADPGLDALEILALEEALEELAGLDARQARIVELRYFGGLSVPEVATVMDVGARTVDREWRCARAWLFDRLGGERAVVDGPPDASS